jgi:DNA polymerase-3 subunit delta
VALGGEPERVSKLLYGLKAEGVEAILMLWALHREIRGLYKLHFDVSCGSSPDAAMAAQRVWDKRKPLIKKALQRSNLTKIQQWLKACRKIDRIIKGQEAGRAWDELLELGLQVAGKPIIGTR